MALGSSLLKSQTVLQQLLEEINFQRTKEMRQLLKDDSGFVVLQGTTYWTDLFVRHFLFQTEPDHNIDSDDLLFFVRKKHVKGTSRHMPKYDTEVDVFRKDSRKLPIGDPDVDWEETVYLNLIIHQFNYTLTLAICTRTSPKELQVLRRHSQRVYASPSRRKMDTKGDGEEMTYPHICFMVDNFDEVFSDIMVRDGEMVCVELVASDRDGSVQGVIFLGSIRYDALKKVYDSRQSSLSSKVAQRMTFGLFSSGGPSTRCEFVRMKGPQGKGHAEMAVTKPKGSGVETPTSEPGFCATDMWDEWEEDPDDYYNYRHQRRLSDPSANLNNFSRYGWKAKAAAGNGAGESVGGGGPKIGNKARSENEGLDSLASELSEIEAGDLKDDRPASSKVAASSQPPPTSAQSTQLRLPTHPPDPLAQRGAEPITTPPSSASTNCCPGCFGRPSSFRTNRRLLKKRWSDAGSNCQMSEVYCRVCEQDEADEPVEQGPQTEADAAATAVLSAVNEDADSPACLATVPATRQSNTTRKKKPTNLLNVESELELPGSGTKLKLCSAPSKEPYAVNNNNDSSTSRAASIEELEFGDDVSAGIISDQVAGTTVPLPSGILDESQVECRQLTRVHGSEELPVPQTNTQSYPVAGPRIEDVFDDQQQGAVRLLRGKLGLPVLSQNASDPVAPGAPKVDDRNGNQDSRDNPSNRNYSTLPRAKRSVSTNEEDQPSDEGKPSHPTISNFADVSLVFVSHPNGSGLRRKVPMRTTPDGTNIYYWCDMSRKANKELDDGAYNPLWASRGFTQTFHFWKEHRRQQSTPLNAFLTYVTLPWWSIAKDLLDHRETPILTF